MTLPNSRLVAVNLSAPPPLIGRVGFGGIAILTATAKAGKVDAANRTRLYSDINEVAADWDAADDFYRAAKSAFDGKFQPTLVKAAFYDETAATTAETMASELDAITAYDDDWFWAIPGATMRANDGLLDGLVDWIEARAKLALIDSNDSLMTDPADATNVAARHKGNVRNTVVIYSPHAGEEQAAGLAAYMASRNFDFRESGFSALAKNIAGAKLAKLPSADVTAITGMIVGQGQSITAGHCANVLIDQAGYRTLVHGSTLTPNLSIAQVYFEHWMRARLIEGITRLSAESDIVPYSNEGFTMLGNRARETFEAGVRAGLIADAEDPETGEYLERYIVTDPRLEDSTGAMRQAGIAPVMRCAFRFLRSVQFISIDVEVTV